MLSAKNKRAIREWAIYLLVTVPFALGVGLVFYLGLRWAGVQ